jgi:ribonuclease D
LNEAYFYPGTEVLVDSLAPGIDLQPFFDLMVNEQVLKVFHSARQDIEIVHHLAGVIPRPIFDTQVAAMVCGFGEAVSYSMLVKRLLSRNLDKTSRFTDWSRRPLSERQYTYALGDVEHLRDLYPKLRSQLDRSERASWLNEEMAVLTDPATYELHPEHAWKRLKMRIKTPKSLAVLMELAAWREREAQTQDVPRARILKDEALYDIASQAPRLRLSARRLLKRWTPSRHCPQPSCVASGGNVSSLLAVWKPIPHPHRSRASIQPPLRDTAL